MYWNCHLSLHFTVVFSVMKIWPTSLRVVSEVCSSNLASDRLGCCAWHWHWAAVSADNWSHQQVNTWILDTSQIFVHNCDIQHGWWDRALPGRPGPSPGHLPGHGGPIPPPPVPTGTPPTPIPPPCLAQPSPRDIRRLTSQPTPPIPPTPPPHHWVLKVNITTLDADNMKNTILVEKKMIALEWKILTGIRPASFIAGIMGHSRSICCSRK
mgnify:CR=1 FL=1